MAEPDLMLEACPFFNVPMSSKRPLFLMLALMLVVLATGVLGYDTWKPGVMEWWELRKDPPLPGENRLGRLALKQKDDRTWTATFEYYFTGYPRFAHLGVSSHEKVGEVQRPGTAQHDARQAQRGLHTVTVEIRRPVEPDATGSTEDITVTLTGYPTPTSPRVLAQVTAPERIEWIDRATIENRPENVLARAVTLIDGEQFSEAKGLLDALVAREPRFDPAYVELARIAMKTNWSSEGLQTGERLIRNALEIRPDSVNAKILLAYVYQHQKRFPEAEALTKEVAQAGTDNLWHWANWAEMHELQGRADEAIGKYREGLARPRAKGSSDRPRRWMYRHLLALLHARSDWDAADSVYRMRMEEFPRLDCYALDYGDFLLHTRADAAAALRAVRDVKEGRCDGYSAADLRGAAEYLRWAAATAEPDRTESLRQARVFLPPGPLMFYQLARSDGTTQAARKLIAGGEKIGAQNSQHYDALAIALGSHDLAAARRLLQLGARTDSLVGDEKMPVALIPVLMRDLEAVEMMRKAGVDYGKVRFQGMTAPDVARRKGDGELLRALEPKPAALSS